MLKQRTSQLVACVLLLSLLILTFVASTNAKEEKTLSTQLAAAFKLSTKRVSSKNAKRRSPRKNRRLIKKKRSLCRQIRILKKQIKKLSFKLAKSSKKSMNKIVRNIKIRKSLIRKLKRKLRSVKRKLQKKRNAQKKRQQKKRQQKKRRSASRFEKLKKRVLRLANKQRRSRRATRRVRKTRRPRIIILAFNRTQFFKKLLRNKKHRFFGKRGFRKYARLLSLLKWVRAKKAALSKKRSALARKEKKIVKLLRKLKQKWSIGKSKRKSNTKITRIVLKNVESKKKVKLVIPKKLKKKVKKIVVYTVNQ